MLKYPLILFLTWKIYSMCCLFWPWIGAYCLFLNSYRVLKVLENRRTGCHKDAYLWTCLVQIRKYSEIVLKYLHLWIELLSKVLSDTPWHLLFTGGHFFDFWEQEQISLDNTWMCISQSIVISFCTVNAMASA